MESTSRVFWGLVVKPGKRYELRGHSFVFFENLIGRPFFRYEQIAEEDFHVSKACIDPSTVDDGPTTIYVESESDEFIIANLTMRALSENLDLNFIAGEKICFRSEVKCRKKFMTGHL